MLIAFKSLAWQSSNEAFLWFTQKRHFAAFNGEFPQALTKSDNPKTVKIEPKHERNKDYLELFITFEYTLELAEIYWRSYLRVAGYNSYYQVASV